MDYPPNSKRVAPQEKHIERVTSVDAVRRKKSLGKQFRETFVAGDAKTAMHYVVFQVFIPSAKDMLAEAGEAWLRSLIFGESRGRRGHRSSGPMGYVNYSGISRNPQEQRSISKRARSQHDFDEIVLVSRSEAEEVIDRLFDLVSQWGSASVADLYELTGLPITHTDHKWGWTALKGATVSRTRSGGYLLDLPEPEPV